LAFELFEALLRDVGLVEGRSVRPFVKVDVGAWVQPVNAATAGRASLFRLRMTHRRKQTLPQVAYLRLA